MTCCLAKGSTTTFGAKSLVTGYVIRRGGPAGHTDIGSASETARRRGFRHTRSRPVVRELTPRTWSEDFLNPTLSLSAKRSNSPEFAPTRVRLRLTRYRNRRLILKTFSPGLPALDAADQTVIRL